MSDRANDPRAAINALSRELSQLVRQSRGRLDAALLAAWHMGHLLREERKRVRRAMGPAAWQQWLTANFRGTHTAASRYIMLAESVPDAAGLSSLTLQQAYHRLNVSTAPKTRSSRHSRVLPGYAHAAQRLLISVRGRLVTGQMTPTQHDFLRQDLTPLYEQLRLLFSDAPSARSPLRANIGQPSGR